MAVTEWHPFQILLIFISYIAFTNGIGGIGEAPPLVECTTTSVQQTSRDGGQSVYWCADGVIHYGNFTLTEVPANVVKKKGHVSHNLIDSIKAKAADLKSLAGPTVGVTLIPIVYLDLSLHEYATPLTNDVMVRRKIADTKYITAAVWDIIRIEMLKIKHLGNVPGDVDESSMFCGRVLLDGNVTVLYTFVHRSYYFEKDVVFVMSDHNKFTGPLAVLETDRKYACNTNFYAVPEVVRCIKPVDFLPMLAQDENSGVKIIPRDPEE